MSAAAGAGSARGAAVLALNLAMVFSLLNFAASAEVKADQRRVIITYSSRTRSSIGQWRPMLLSQGVSIVQDLGADNLAVISGPTDSVIAEALKLPGIESVEEDIIMTAHVG